jgi:hypothetical protein
MAAQSASPAEAEVARKKLATLPPPRTLSRDDIMAAPNLRPHVPAVRVWDASLRVHVVMDADDPAFLDLALDEDG